MILQILTNAFRQKSKVVLADGTETSDAPDVTPPRFIEAVKGIIRNFGNVGESEVGYLVFRGGMQKTKDIPKNLPGNYCVACIYALRGAGVRSLASASLPSFFFRRHEPPNSWLVGCW